MGRAGARGSRFGHLCSEFGFAGPAGLVDSVVTWVLVQSRESGDFSTSLASTEVGEWRLTRAVSSRFASRRRRTGCKGSRHPWDAGWVGFGGRAEYRRAQCPQSGSHRRAHCRRRMGGSEAKRTWMISRPSCLAESRDRGGRHREVVSRRSSSWHGTRTKTVLSSAGVEGPAFCDLRICCVMFVVSGPRPQWRRAARERLSMRQETFQDCGTGDDRLGEDDRAECEQLTPECQRACLTMPLGRGTGRRVDKQGTALRRRNKRLAETIATVLLCTVGI